MSSGPTPDPDAVDLRPDAPKGNDRPVGHDAVLAALRRDTPRYAPQRGHDAVLAALRRDTPWYAPQRGHDRGVGRAAARHAVVRAAAGPTGVLVARDITARMLAE